MNISERGLNLIKNFEGCRLKAYKPVASEKYWTIGWGHYGPDVSQGMVITQAQADAYLKQDIKTYEAHVRRICNYLDLNQNQFDALVSFTYNCGSGSLLKLTKSQTRTIAQIAEHIEAYNKGANNQVLAGLVRRRKAEKALFLEPIPIKEPEDDEDMVRYQKVEEMPEYARETITKLVKVGVLKGDQNGNLDLSEDMMRILVILDRSGIFNIDPKPVWEPEDERPGGEEWDKDFNL